MSDDRIGPYHVAIFTLCGACLIMDGFDVQAIGYVAPALIQDWKIPAADMGPVFSAGLLGLFLGSLLFSMLGDRIGRRPVVLGATVAFSVLTLLTARVTSLSELMIMRVLAGLGLGAILPNITALIGEYSPSRHRVTTMMIVTNGFTIGAMIGGFLSAWLIPAYGWRSVFVVGGVVPLLLLPAMFAWLPESLGRDERRERFPLARLFADGRGIGTVLLWTVNFMNVLNAYFVSSWLPTVVRGAGYPTETAVLVGASVQTGGVLGTLALGWVLRRVGFVPVLTCCFVLAAVNLALIGQPGLSLSLLFVVAFLAGLGIFAGQPGLNALAATFYPIEMRSTGIGAGLGIGRFGAFIGPLLAGELMRNHWTTQDLFHAAAVPAAISAMAIVAIAVDGEGGVKAVRVHTVGGPEVLTYEDVDVPRPGAGEALVKIAASGLNYLDVQYRIGRLKAPTPFVIGSEAAGLVTEVGSGVTDLKVGDRVAWAMTLGSYAEYAVVPASKLVAIPTGVDLQIAAGVMLQGLTAHYLTHSTFALKPSDTALVHAAAGGVGSVIVQVARIVGARVIATAGTEAKAELARQAGANEVIVYTKQDFEAEVKRLTGGRGVDVVYDSVGKDTFDKSLNCLRPRGMLALFGFSSGLVPPFDPAILGTKGSLFLTRPGLNQYMATRDELLSRTNAIFEWLASGKLKIRIGHVFPMAEARKAHEELEARRTTGKVLLT